MKQLALHIDTWYTSRGVGKEQAVANIEAVANTVRWLWQAQDRETISQNLSLDDRQLAHFALGDTQQQNGEHDESFLR